MDAATFENELTVLTHRQEGTIDEFHRSYEAAIDDVRSTFGNVHPHLIGGHERSSEDTYRVTSPGATDVVVGRFAAGDATDVDEAVRAAAEAFEPWRDTHWSERVAIFREAADIIRSRKYDLAALLTLENGKNRTEAMADIDEGIDFLRLYARELERHDGYRMETGEPTPGQHCSSRLEPFGVFGVIGPFNFPFAIFSGMTTGAAITGNTVVTKPAPATSLIAHKFVEILFESGVPDGVVNLVTGSGREVGQPLVRHEDVRGIVFTGSLEVGREIQQTFVELNKSGPVIAELGGKNSVIVTSSAELEKAVEGVKAGAFGFSGQKCSATARVYVDEAVLDPFIRTLVNETEELSIVPPEQRDAFISPLIDDAAVERYERICRSARETGSIETGGRICADPELSSGRYVEPTVVTDVPHEHELAREEHFLPFVTIHPVGDLEEALHKANDSRFGLCAGIFSEADADIERWLQAIEAGMCYVNRHQSATTGALVQAQPFGGWKASGTTNKFAGGYWYLPQFMREQTRTVVT